MDFPCFLLAKSHALYNASSFDTATKHELVNTILLCETDLVTAISEGPDFTQGPKVDPFNFKFL